MLLRARAVVSEHALLTLSVSAAQGQRRSGFTRILTGSRHPQGGGRGPGTTARSAQILLYFLFCE